MITSLVSGPVYGNLDGTNIFSKKSGCLPLSKGEFVSFRAAALQPFLPTLGSVVLRSEFNKWDKGKQAAFFGTLVDTVAERDEIRGFSTDGSYSRKSASRMRDFIRRKTDGEIVLNPIQKYRYEGQEVPLLSAIDPSQDRDGFRLGDLRDTYGIIGKNCSSVDGSDLNIISGFPDIRVHSSALWLRSPQVTRSLANTVVKRYYSSKRELDLDCSAIASKVLQSLEVSQGLVTSTRAAANSGVYDLLTELAELPETVKYIYSVIKEILTLFKSTRKEVLKLASKRRWETEAQKTAQTATAIASLWMQFRYAIMPLVYSANDALELLSIVHNPYHTTRDGESAKTTISHFGEDVEVDVVHRCFIKRRYGARGTTTSDFLKFDVAATAWELVPLSFVVDWAFNVGDFLSALGTPEAVQQEAAQYSWKTTQSLSLKTPTGSTLSVALELYEARPINPGDHIGLNLDLFMNLKRTLDALALSWLLFKKKT